MIPFLYRIIGAAALDVTTYEEIEADRHATVQGLCVVFLSAVATGIGATGFGGDWTLAPTVAIVAMAAWLSWALLTYHLGIRLATPETHSDVPELLRTLGFAAAPGLVCGVGVIPPFAGPAFAVATLWMLAAMIVAVRQALDYRSTARAVTVCIIGWILAVALVFVWGSTTPVLSDERAPSRPAPLTASPADDRQQSDPGVYRLAVRRDGRTRFAGAVAIRRDPEPASARLHLLTAASLFRDEHGRRVKLDSVEVEITPGEPVAVGDDDITLCPNGYVDLALLRIDGVPPGPAAPVLTAAVPSPGSDFRVTGFDAGGAPVRATARVSRVATLMVVGGMARALSDCAGAAVASGGAIFGLATTCDDRALVYVVPFAGVESWLTRRVPGGVPMTPARR